MNPKDAWNAAYHQLELQFDRATFETWLRDARLIGFDENTFIIGVKNSYARDMLQHRFYRGVRRLVSDIYGQSVEIRFEIIKAPQPVDIPKTSAKHTDDMPLFRALSEQETPQETVQTPLHQQVARPQRPELPESELNARYTFDRFIAGNENSMVLAAALAVAERPAVAYNPFFIYGGVGLGKTHLLQAIAHECRSRNMRVVYVPSEVFTNDLIDSIRTRSTAMFREKYRTADVLLIDDIQFIAGKDTTQEEFFHTFNTLYTYNKQVILASDRHPNELETLEARLRSRFEGGLIAKVQPVSLETRLAILKNWIAERKMTVSKHVLEMLAERAVNSVREMEGMFTQMIATMQLTQTPITRDLAEDILEGYHRPRFNVTAPQVIDVASRYFGLTIQDLTGPRRNERINTARQIAMFLSRELTNLSLPQIGDEFGGRKHSTVLHACRSVQESIDNDVLLTRAVNEIRDRLVRRSDD